jgi:S-formylglutathione hydrolase FrmB
LTDYDTHDATMSAAISLTHGWIPVAAQLITAGLLVAATGWRSRRWRVLWLPVALVTGIAVATAVNWWVADQGLADAPIAMPLSIWIALGGFATAMAVLGWRGARWWRRGAGLVSVALCVLCAALALNSWVNYLPTVTAAWQRLTGAPLPDQTDPATAAAMPRTGTAPTSSSIVAVTIPDDASGFKHRQELVYLPPAWYQSTPPPQLPVVMMIGGEFGHPADWVQAGQAQHTIEAFAAAHGGNAPVLVFVDDSGAFSNDTECVNGTRGNAADHLTKDVLPYMASHFGTSADPANWGIVGWSSGGTCALTLATMHPELFGAFVDIDGQLGPNTGTTPQTIARLFGGDASAWASFDPLTVMSNHPQYPGMSAWFAVSADTETVYHAANDPGAAGAVDLSDTDRHSEDHVATANQLCGMASTHGMECAVVPVSGNHDFSSADAAFAAALPWLAGKLATPEVPAIPLPGAPAG